MFAVFHAQRDGIPGAPHGEEGAKCSGNKPAYSFGGFARDLAFPLNDGES